MMADRTLFQGFVKPTTTDTPNDLFDVILPRIDSLAELKCVLYVIRRTFGFDKRMDRISLSQFEDGIVTRTGKRLDFGTGLTRRSIINGLRKAVSHNYLKRIVMCPDCHGEIERILVRRQYKVPGREGETKVKDVPVCCPHCGCPLKGREEIYYGLRWAEERGKGSVGSTLPPGVDSTLTIGGGGGEGGGGGGDGHSKNLLQQRLAQFAWDDHEQEVIEGLLADGYSAAQIARVIERTLADRPPDADPIRRLTYFEPIIRSEPPHADGGTSAEGPAPSPAEGAHTDEQARTSPGTAEGLTGTDQERGAHTDGPATVAPAEGPVPRLDGQASPAEGPHADEVNLSAVWALCESVNITLDQRTRAALLLLARRFSSPGRDIAEWLACAVEEAIIQGADNIPAYVRRVLARWDSEAKGEYPGAVPVAGDMPLASMLEGRPAEGEEGEVNFTIGDRPSSEVWEEVLEHLRGQVTKATFDTWLRRSRLIGCQDSTLVVVVPTSYSKDWLENRLQTVVQRAVWDAVGPGWRVRFVTPERSEAGE